MFYLGVEIGRPTLDVELLQAGLGTVDPDVANVEFAVTQVLAEDVSSSLCYLVIPEENLNKRILG